MRLAAIQRLFGIAILSFSVTQPAWGANCEPTDTENRKSIEELVGPLKEKPREKTPEEDKAEQEQRLAERRAKKVREMRQAEIDRLTAKLQTALDDPNLWLSRARIRAEIDLREGAISDLTQFMKLKGKSAELLAERGKLYYSLHQFEAAEADLNEAVQLEPDNPEILFARGKLFIEQWKTVEAYGDFSKVIEMEPRHKLARYNRAYLLMNVKSTYGNNRQAAEDLEIVVDLDPDWLLARYHFVRVLRALGRYEEVVRHSTFVIWHDPDSECMYLYRGSAYRNLDKFDLALRDATKYLEFNPRDKSRILTRALLYSRMEEHEKAIEDWNVYLEIIPDNAVGYYQLAKSYKALKRYEDALAAHDKLVELEPDESDWQLSRARLKADIGDFQGAITDVTTSIDMGATNYHDRANIYRDMGEHAKAWADDAYQPIAVKAFVGRSDEYEQELAEEEKELVAHVNQHIDALKGGKQLHRQKSFQPHRKHPSWGRLWLQGLTTVISSDDVEQQKLGLQGFRKLVENIEAFPISPEDTQAAVDALTKFAAGNHPEPQKREARILAKDLNVLQIANDPKTEAWQPGSLHYTQLTIEKDEEGRPGEFKDIGLEWLESKNGYTVNRFREIRHTPEFIELFCLKRALWVRLEADEAYWSFNRENWQLIGKGTITRR
ncbi:tetratricopeptide repeat protein [Bremerella sp. P1]|uniref:tetratricopeptide repeat protein n=1 Tax=Bremerella sp. P1 TaxID=3026424 RepID=UPI002368EB9E|nr:tetratricopeptide repeat protein [Bremerella sp. P1]WDI44081.1 tetratricopeptide repeat protein [Bremerella sp. P1]